MYVRMRAKCMLSPIEPLTLNLLRDCVSPLTSTFHGIPSVMMPVSQEEHTHLHHGGANAMKQGFLSQSLTATAHSCPSPSHSHSTMKVSTLGLQALKKSSHPTSSWAIKLEEWPCLSPSSKIPNMVKLCTVCQMHEASEALQRSPQTQLHRPTPMTRLRRAGGQHC
jgi:hypothetical protein